MPKAMKKKVDMRKYNGGRRRGAGRPMGIRGELLRGLLPEKSVYVFEPIVVKMHRHGQMRRVKTTRGKIAINRLSKYVDAGVTSSWMIYDYFERLQNGGGTVKQMTSVLFEACEYLKKRDEWFNRIIDSAVPSPKPVLKKSWREVSADIKKTNKQIRKISKQIAAKKVVEEEAVALKKELEKEYKRKDIDQWGRPIQKEKEWKARNGEALDKYLRNKQ